MKSIKEVIDEIKDDEAGNLMEEFEHDPHEFYHGRGYLRPNALRWNHTPEQVLVLTD